MSKIQFSKEQLDFLKHILRIECCHVSGLHDPLHCVENKYICESQKAEAWKRAMTELEIEMPTPFDVISKHNCYYCNVDKEKKGA